MPEKKNADIAVRLFNEAVGEDEAVSIRWWQRMEQHNAVPLDERRRRIIQVMLNIPPTTLGLQALETLLPKDGSGDSNDENGGGESLCLSGSTG